MTFSKDWQPARHLPGYEQRINPNGYLETRPIISTPMELLMFEDAIKELESLQQNMKDIQPEFETGDIEAERAYLILSHTGAAIAILAAHIAGIYRKLDQLAKALHNDGR